MQTKLIRVGNSHGVRIPRALIEAAELGDELEMTLEGKSIVLRTQRQPREGWDVAFAEMAAAGDDVLLDEPVGTEWDAEEWTWQ
jgi:antitoxin MazE